MECEQLGLFKPRGGKRRGAGRKPRGARAGAAHKKRPKLAARYPVHVVLRVRGDVGNLRRKPTYLAVRAATEIVAAREGFRIVHLSLQRGHIHLIVEANDEHALSRGMQAFQISAARHINAALVDDTGVRRRGSVFPDRYHASIITTPKQARHTLNYTLNNWRKHGEDADGIARTWQIDFFSSAPSFTDWAEADQPEFARQAPSSYEPLRVSPAGTWLLREGWKRWGLISCHDTPLAR